MSRPAEFAGVAACLLVFVFFAAAWIHLPGPQHDELLHVPVLLPSLRPAALFSMKIEDHAFPLMIMSYVGALKGWLLWLWFRVVPEGVPGYRAFGITLGLATLAMTFWFVRRYWGSPVALITAALAATDPSIVHTTRLDYGPVALMQFLKMAALCLFSRWLASGSWKSLAGGMFALGFGIWDKANFVWFLAGLGVTVLALFPRETLSRLRWSPLALVMFLLGAAPFLAYNLKREAETWRERGRFEIRWFKLLQAQGTIHGDFMSALTGEDHLDASPEPHDLAFPRLAGWMYDLGRRRQTIILPLLGLALILLPWNLWRGHRRVLLFPLLLALFTYAAMFITFDGGSSVHHVVMVQPFPLLFLAASLWLPQWPRLIPVGVVGAAILVNLSVNARHLAIYTRTGGTGGFTDAVYRLVPFLARHPGRGLYALDWGFGNPVQFLGRRWNLRVDEIFYSLNSPDGPNHVHEVERLATLMRDPNNLFLLHSPQRTLFPAPSEAFFSLSDGGIPMRQVAFFEERTGQIVYEVYQHGDAPAARDLPPEVEVIFSPPQVRRNDTYVMEVKQYPNTWIDVVYHVGRTSSGTATRFCRTDAEGRAQLTVPPGHPEATVRITLIRPSGGEWRPARGSITVIP